KILLIFAGYALKLLGVGWRFLFGGNIRPLLCKIRVHLEPLLDAGLGIGLDRLDRAFRLANTAIDAFVRMNDQHVLALVETIHGANLDAVHVFALDAIIVDDIGHLLTLNVSFSRALLLPHGTCRCKVWALLVAIRWTAAKPEKAGRHRAPNRLSRVPRRVP